MENQQKTHWKKNIDSRYISGEDMQFSLKGLKPEMVVKIVRTSDSTAFDQKKQTDITVTALYLVDQNNKPLDKPVVLNVKNSKTLSKEFGSPYIEDWMNKPVIIKAVKDSRHGYVVRFDKYTKTYLQANTELFNKAKTALEKGSYTIEQIKDRYTVSPEVEALLLNNPS